MKVEEVKNLFNDFLKDYNTSVKDKIWLEQSDKFRNFWNNKVILGKPNQITDYQIDEIVRILDRNGKGNRKDAESIARAMIPQIAWRSMFRELCSDKDLSNLITKIFEESDIKRKINLIDKLYDQNKGRRNYLTGRSGNAINTLLAAFDPIKNLSMISLKDRMLLIDYFEFPVAFDFEKVSSGFHFIESNRIILEGFSKLGIEGSARTIASFCYYKMMMPLWRDRYTVKLPDKDIVVSIPSDQETEEDEVENNINKEEETRESITIQALLAKIGSEMGLKIWLPRSDRNRVLKRWTPNDGVLLESLPLNYNNAVMKTIENIDVLWLKGNSILRAFEVEHTTSIYSGILRMADLLAMLPNIDIKLHIVAPAIRREKVFEEIQRPIFSMIEKRPMKDLCTFISYDNVVELSEEKHLGNLKESVLDEFEEAAE